MFSIIGIVVVFGCILAGYLMEHGPLKVLMQPAELIIIGGAAMGTVLISNPVHTLKQMISGLLGVFGSSKFNTKFYTDSLKMMYELLQKARKEGLVALETDIGFLFQVTFTDDVAVDVSSVQNLNTWLWVS